MHLDNPAQTLRQFLLAITNYSNSGQILRKALLEILGLEVNKLSEQILWEKISKLMTLPYKIDETLNDYFTDEEITAPNWKVNVIKFFSSMNINASVSQHRTITQETFNELGLISLLFKTKGEIGKLANEDIIDIQQQLSELKNSVIESNLSKELRKDILHYINNIIRSLEDYAITGIEPLISSIEATLGHACISPAFQDVVKNTEIGGKLKSILKRSLSAVSSVEGVVSLGANALTLIEHFSK